MTTYFIFGLGPRLADYQHDGVGLAHPRQILYTTLKKIKIHVKQPSRESFIKNIYGKMRIWKNYTHPHLKTHPPRKINFFGKFFLIKVG